jgi:hypothetical protein
MPESYDGIEGRLDLELMRLESQEGFTDLKPDSGAEDPLRPLLLMAGRLRNELRPPEPDPAFVRNSEIRVMNQIKARSEQTSVSAPGPGSRYSHRRWLGASALAGVVLIAMLFTSFGLIPASASALPGDALYPVKRGLESTRLALTFGEQAKEALLIEYSAERLKEIVALSDSGRTEYLNQAASDYAESIDKLSAQAPLTVAPGLSSPSTLDTTLAHNVEVLQSLLAKVPAQARPAIQRAIDRSLKKSPKEKASPPDSTLQPEQTGIAPGTVATAVPADSDQRQAEQMGRQYGVSPDEILSTFQGICQQDWKCVRDHYRQAGRGKAHPNR